MTDVIDQKTGEILWEAPTEIPRDGWGRPMVTPLDGSKPVAYTRCTTFVGCLEDQFGLGKWQQRKTAEGLASRPDLLLRVNSLGPEPDKYLDAAAAKTWGQAMDATVKDAIEAAKAHAKATIGTALHALTERIDRGQDVGVVPDAYLTHLTQYVRATSAFTHHHIERFTVLDELKIGGTPDRVMTVEGLPGAYIGDLKTGSTEYGIGKMCMQLAVYSRSVLYDPATGAREPYGVDVNQDRGLIIALNSSTGDVELLWVDIKAGWEAVQIAADVRAWRARRGLSQPFELPAGVADSMVVSAPTPNVVDDRGPALSSEAEAALTVAIDRASSPDELVSLWRAAGDRWTPTHTARAAARKAVLLQAA